MGPLINLPAIVLASQSPRRRQLLEALGLKFRCESPTNVLEKEPDCANVVSVTQQNALLKARAVVSKDEKEIIVGADTLVVLEKEVLGKPKDRDSAASMLQKLSGERHRVVTGVALISPYWGVRTAVVTSQVHFKAIPQASLEAYLSTREPYDKAGAYAVQGLGSLFIDRIEGSYTNVMGLPIEKFIEELAALTQTAVFDWF